MAAEHEPVEKHASPAMQQSWSVLQVWRHCVLASAQLVPQKPRGGPSAASDAVLKAAMVSFPPPSSLSSLSWPASQLWNSAARSGSSVAPPVAAAAAAGVSTTGVLNAAMDTVGVAAAASPPSSSHVTACGQLQMPPSPTLPL